jgi:hypothetical protein
MHRWLLAALPSLLFACSDYGFGGHANGVVVSEDPDTDIAEGDGLVDTALFTDTDVHEIVENDADTDTDGDTDADADTDGDTDGDTDADADTDTDVPEIPDDACEQAVELDGYLDQFEVPGDGRVFYCHSGSGNYVQIESNISSCLPHLNHSHDVFPTTLCGS